MIKEISPHAMLQDFLNKTAEESEDEILTLIKSVVVQFIATASKDLSKNYPANLKKTDAIMI